MAYNISDHVQDRLLKTYKKSIPNVQRFFETKLEVNLQDQEMEFQEKEKEILDLENKVSTAGTETDAMKQLLDQCVERVRAVGSEVKRSYVSRSFLREERRCLEELYNCAALEEKHEPVISTFCDNIHAIIDYVEMGEDRRAHLEHRINSPEKDDLRENGHFGMNGRTITSKVHAILDNITDIMEKTTFKGSDGTYDIDVRTELEKTTTRLKEVMKDLSYVKHVFLTTLRKKEDLSQETLSLVHNFREIRRLEKEMHEKQDHIQELRKRGQTLTAKSKKHKRHVEQIQGQVSQKEKQLTELYDDLQRQVSSADQRVHFILKLLPDTEGGVGNYAFSDQKSDGDVSNSFSRDVTCITVVPDRSDSRMTLQSENSQLSLPSTNDTSCKLDPKPPVTHTNAKHGVTSETAQKVKTALAEEHTKANVDRLQRGAPAEARGTKVQANFIQVKPAAQNNQVNPVENLILDGPDDTTLNGDAPRSQVGPERTTPRANKTSIGVVNIQQESGLLTQHKSTQGKHDISLTGNPRMTVSHDNKDSEKQRLSTLIPPTQTEQAVTKSATQISISVAAGNPQPTTDVSAQKLPTGPRKSSHQSPASAPRSVVKPVQPLGGRTLVNNMSSERPGPSPRTSRVNTADDKEQTMSASRVQTSSRFQVGLPPRVEQPRPWMVRPVVSSKHSLKSPNGECEAILSSTAYPPSKARGGPKSSGHSVSIGHRLGNPMRSTKNGPGVYSRVSDAIAKVNDIKNTTESPQQPNEKRRSLNHRYTLRTDSYDNQNGQTETFPLESLVSDDSNHDGERVSSGDNCLSLTKTPQSTLQGSRVSDLDESPDRQRVSSAATHVSTSRLNRQQSEDPNKYPPRQVLMANKVELK